ncbi:MAG TPA: polyribonucleotide nucleotidyltransferase [Firmicutes bacterium]|jgi:polyribonucleotide nucleotidyltransferase|nr:polyribonucleotide nucleotidyltransferase [Bacillota bacterium]
MHSFTMHLAGRELTLEAGRMAKQAHGSVLVKYGDTYVLVTATVSKQPREGIDFFPLLVDYEERLYSVGKIPGGFIKRETRPGEKAILAARLIDRPLRPLFPKGFRNDVQVVATVLSVDQDNSPEIAAMIGASAALTISKIPFAGPIAGVAVGKVNGQLVINPTQAQADESELYLVVAGTKDAIMMVEARANEVPEAEMIEALLFGHETIKEIVALQEEMRAAIGEEKMEFEAHVPEAELQEAVEAFAKDKLEQAVRNANKQEREANMALAEAEILEHFQDVFPEREKEVREVVHSTLKQIVRDMIVNHNERPDGRRADEIRPISCEVGVLPRVHGSGLFTRGQTQVLSIVTLGAMSEVQILDDLTDDENKRYMHHYNFPPYSVGETRPIRGPSRRDIGHGALGEKALLPMIPSEEEFPYAIRVVSEVLESNGSSSQASICGSTLALMDAGVPIKRPVAGIAMGLVCEDTNIAILSDIQGIEDALGDMDFKVAGTEKGITALQMDIKISGVDADILQRAMEQARRGRLFILDKMLAVLPQPRPELSPYAPRMLTLTVPVDKIKDVIGPGGKVINKIIAETGVKIDIEDDGRIFIAAVDTEAGERAKQMIEDITAEVEVGRIYQGRVTRVEKYGVFVEVLPGKEGLVHISQLDNAHVARTEDVCQLGDIIPVKVTEIDRMGRINLSRKEALKEEAK